MTKRTFFVFSALTCCFIFNTSKAQEYPIFYHSQYLMNPVLINPAVSGALDYGSLQLSVRSVAGDKLSPTTSIISFHNRLSSDSKMGLGGTLFNDVDGPFYKTGLQAAYAYHLPLGRSSKKTYLSFGISASAIRYSVNPGNVQADRLLYEENHGITPDANIGAYFYSPEFFAGVSATNVLESPFKTKNAGLEEVDNYREYFLYTGYTFELPLFSIQPSVLARANEDDFEDIANVFDYNLKVIMEPFIVGASYRSDESVVILGNYSFKFVALGIAYNLPAASNLAFRGYTEVVLQVKIE